MLRYIKQVLLVIFFCSLFAAKAQVFNSNYLTGKVAAAFRSLALVNDTLVAYGYAAEWFPPYPVKYTVQKVTTEGIAAYGYTAMLDSFTDYFTQGPLLVMPNGDYVFGGSAGTIPVFFRLSNTGQILVHREYGIDSIYTLAAFVDIQPLGDTGFVAVESFSASAGGIITIRLNAAGEVIWRRVNQSLPIGQLPTGISVLPDATILVSATRDVSVTNDARHNTYFLHYDTAGNFLSYWLDTINRTSGAYSYTPLPGGGGIYCGTWMDTAWINTGGSYALKKGYIVREDAAHTKLWELKLGHRSAIPQLYKIKALNDGNFLAVGGTYDTTYTDGQPYKNTGWLVKFTAQGQVLWQRRFFNTSDYPAQTNYLYDFVEMPNRDIVAAGERIDFMMDYPQRGWLLRVDADGCLYPGSCDVMEVPDVMPEINISLSAFPVPCSNSLACLSTALVNNSVLQLADMHGRVALQQEVEPGQTALQLNTAGLAPGLYILTLANSTGVLARCKVVKQ